VANGRLTPTLAYTIIAMFTCTLIMFIVSLVYATHAANAAVDRANQSTATQTRQFCSLMTTLDDTYRATPPATLTGKRVAAEVHSLRLGLGC
jgi:hypothetical protein